MIIGARLDRQEIEDGILDAINTVLTANNHYPDLKTLADEVAFNAAIAALKGSGNNIIGVLNQSAPWRYQEDYYDQFIIQFIGNDPGSIAKFARFIEEIEPQTNPKTGKLYEIDGETVDLNFTVRYISQDPATVLLMEKYLVQALGQRKHIPALLDDDTYGQKFLIRRTAQNKLSTEKEVEMIFVYTVFDVWQQDATEIQTVPDATIHYDIDTGDGNEPQTPDYEAPTP